MKVVHIVVVVSSVTLMILGTGLVPGQAYPNKPIRIQTSPAGGGADLQTRIIAEGISGLLGQQVIVENRPTLIAIESTLKSPPDGYTLVYAGTNLWIGPLLQPAPYDPVTGFSPVSLTTTLPLVLVVHPSLPVKTVKELIALAKARPGEFNYVSSSLGGTTHLAMELFKYRAGINIVRIAYATGEMVDLVAGRVPLTFVTASGGTPYIKAGKLRPLAITSTEPSALFPGLPTMAASGLPGFEAIQNLGVFAPPKTPAAIITRLNQEIVRVLGRPDVKEKFFNIGSETVGSTPEAFTAQIKSEVATFGNVIKVAGIKAE